MASLEIADWLNGIGSMFAIIAFFSLFSYLPSMFSYLGFVSDKSSYYKKMKIDIIKSTNYEHFKSLRS